MSDHIGIDFGTADSVVAYFADDRTKVIDNAEGDRTTPSTVLFTESGDVVVGRSAEREATMQPDRYVGDAKRHVGEDTTFQVGDLTKRPEEVVAWILRKLARDAGERLGTEVESAVIAVPASFTHRQRQAMVKAGELAGIAVEALLPEPNAAVLAYGFKQQKLGTSDEETVFVYDLGSATFSVSLVRIKYDYGYAETIATEGRLDLGGADWTAALADVLFERIEAETGIDLRADEKWGDARQRVHKAADEAKHRLSERFSTTVTIPYVVPQEGYNLDTTVTRDAFEEATVDLLDATRERIDQLFLDSNVPVDDVDTVLPVGGSSRMPQIETFLEAYFGISSDTRIDPDGAVARGAAVHASLVADDTGSITLADNDHSDAEIVLINTVPSSISLVVRGDDGERTVVPLVEKDTRTPTRSRVDGLVVQEGRTVISAPVVQGDPPDANRNELLGMLRVEGIPRNRRSEIRIEIGVATDGPLRVWGTNLADRTSLSTRLISVHDVGDIDRVHESLPRIL